MISDITMGQYVFVSSTLHRLDARFKLIATTLYISMLFISDNLLGIGLAIVFSLALYALGRIPLRMILRSLRPILPILLFTSVLNMFFASGDVVLFQLWQLTIYRESLPVAINLTLRILCLIAGSSLLTYTTSPLELTFAMESLMNPLRFLRLPVHDLAMMLTIAIRFIPALLEETDKIMSAQKSRGASLDSGRLMQRVRALIPVLIPLFISAFRRADELALAMECRCYRGGEGRTRLKEMHMTYRDLVASVIFLIIFISVIAVKYLPIDLPWYLS